MDNQAWVRGTNPMGAAQLEAPGVWTVSTCSGLGQSAGRGSSGPWRQSTQKEPASCDNAKARAEVASEPGPAEQQGGVRDSKGGRV